MLDYDRIARFRTMTEADPENELGHFSLGKAYYDGGAFEESIPSFLRVLEINSNFSKAWALLARAQLAAGARDAAVITATKGYKIAHERGDLMPRNDIGALLKELDVALPEVKKAELTPEAQAAGQIMCKRCGRVAPKMAERPFSGELGERIHAEICQPCFREWIGQGTKVINELRLNLTERGSQDVYDQHMKEFLNLE